jgi:long-chain acyl-CoA synthetase
MMGCHMYLVPKPVPIKNTVKMFEKYKINVMTGVNTLFNSMTHDPLFRKLAPKTIKIALAGGMALQESVSKSFQKITGVRIIEGFGLTESSPVVICNLLEGEYRIGSCGIPLPSTEAKIVDDNGVEVKFGEVGELVVRGPQVMRGYWNQDEDTRKTIKDGWLWTGDIAKRDADGFFYIVDRKKDMVIVSGFNVYPSEIEDVLSTHPKILESAVIGVKDSKAGEAVKAFIVKKDESLTEEEVREFCKEQLTNYKRPKFFEFRKELPKSNVGKIIRRELRG